MRTYIVTGAARGMGAAAVEMLAGRGMNVLAVDLDGGELKTATAALGVAGRGRVAAVAADVSSEDDVRAFVGDAVRRWGGLDGIFNIAGIGVQHYVPLADVPVSDFDEIMAINARSVFLTMKHVLPHLVARGGGTIVNTGSHLAWHAAPTFSGYCASKHAVLGLTRAVALEYGPLGVRANILCPSAMDTRMGEEAAVGMRPDDPAAGWKILTDQAANGRVARAEEAAMAGVWLLADAPEHVTGIVLPVDSAQSAS
jgi:NAD(P)-dependent dehydrogenase (short-subunit alcohol dehydrogenase family)